MSLFHAGKENDGDPAEQPRSMEEVELKLLRQNRRYHLAIIVGLAVLAIGLLVLTIIDVNNGANVERVGNSNAEALEILRKQTSPERQAQQAEAINEIILRVDCNSRDAISDALDELERNGVLQGPVTVLTAECEGIIPNG